MFSFHKQQMTLQFANVFLSFGPNITRNPSPISKTDTRKVNLNITHSHKKENLKTFTGMTCTLSET